MRDCGGVIKPGETEGGQAVIPLDVSGHNVHRRLMGAVAVVSYLTRPCGVICEESIEAQTGAQGAVYMVYSEDPPHGPLSHTTMFSIRNTYCRMASGSTSLKKIMTEVTQEELHFISGKLFYTTNSGQD